MTAATTEQLQETRRRYFLQAMGVDLYLPRAELVNAKHTALPEPMVVAGKSKAPGGTTSITEPDETPTRASPAQDLGLRPQRKARQNAPPQAAPVQATESLRLQLRVWRAANELLVIDSRDGDIALPTETLLRNMLQALGYPRSEISKGEHLRWPISERGNRSSQDPDRDSADARAMVQAFIEAQQQRYQPRTLLLLGENAKRFALDPEQQDKALWETLGGPGETQVIVLPSLAELLQQPALKKPTWHAIKPLRRERKHT